MGSESGDLPAWIALHAVDGMGAASLRRLLRRFGSPRAVLDASPEGLDAVPRVPRQVVEGIVGQAERLEEHRATAAKLAREGVHTLRLGEPGYPPRLGELPNPPPLLYLRGRLPDSERPTFGIVGTTRASRHGMEVADAAARRLADRGWVVVSGNARGIDAAAHRAALRAGRATILVLPTGILRFCARAGYPPPGELWRCAAALSEWHPQAPWRTAAALARNRVIAALSDALLVVETRERGGAMSTLRHAVALGRRTFVVRFREPAPSAGGNPAAEAAGASPVRSLRELEERLQAPRALPDQKHLPW
ncbi:MAG: DNA-processing protein DprA [Candidatus Brocadiia bacterium]